MKKLTKREKKFCSLYVQTFDYNKTINELGYKINISKPKIRAYINSLPVVLKSFEVDDNPLLQNLYAIATFDPLSMFDSDGDVKPLRVLTPMQRMAIKTYKEDSNGNVKFTLYDKQKALDMLMKHKGLYEKDNAQLKSDLQVGIVNITKDEAKTINKVLENDY
jgi:hypothetical protein